MWNRSDLRFVLVYDAELIRELLKISGEKVFQCFLMFNGPKFQVGTFLRIVLNFESYESYESCEYIQ